MSFFLAFKIYGMKMTDVKILRKGNFSMCTRGIGSQDVELQKTHCSYFRVLNHKNPVSLVFCKLMERYFLMIS